MKRFDCFTFRNEYHLLEARLTEYDDLVDIFVLVQGNRTFGSGELFGARPQLHHERFDRWRDKLRVVHVNLTAADPWGREAQQRNGITEGLDDLQPDDVVWISDVDEFPDRGQASMVPAAPFVCRMRHMAFAPNLEHAAPAKCTVITRGEDWRTPQQLRNARMELPVSDGGFHFSWMPEGGYEAKRAATAHTEYASHPVDDCVRARRHITGDPLTLVTVDDSWPRWFRDGHCPADWWAT